MKLEIGAASDKGRVRRNNEDAFAVRAEQGVFVVCDGMGGAAGGEEASRLAVAAILDHLNGEAPIGGDTVDAGGYRPQTAGLAEAVRRANERIFKQAQVSAGHAEMGTTVVAVQISESIASLAHVGDSRAYLWHASRLEPLTRDHSLVEEQVKAGVLDRSASLQSEQQNILIRALGREPEVEVDVSEVPLQLGDYLLLCSDGLTRMVPEPAMAQAIAELRRPQRICDSLIAAANRNGGPDNITVVVVEVTADGWWQRLANLWIL
jgi:protein phosphatase